MRQEPLRSLRHSLYLALSLLLGLLDPKFYSLLDCFCKISFLAASLGDFDSQAFLEVIIDGHIDACHFSSDKGMHVGTYRRCIEIRLNWLRKIYSQN